MQAPTAKRLFGWSIIGGGFIRIEIGSGTGAWIDEAGTAGVVPGFLRLVLGALAKIYPHKRNSLCPVSMGRAHEHMLMGPAHRP